MPAEGAGGVVGGEDAEAAWARADDVVLAVGDGDRAADLVAGGEGVLLDDAVAHFFFLYFFMYRFQNTH